MQIKCLCGFQLSNKSLSEVRDWDVVDETVMLDGSGKEVVDVIKGLKSGNFRHDVNTYLVGEDEDSVEEEVEYTVCVDREDVIFGVIPEFRDGLGCCDVNVAVRCPGCKERVGGAMYDCVSDVHCVSFDEEKVKVEDDVS